jgi:hypothetical protein
LRKMGIDRRLAVMGVACAFIGCADAAGGSRSVIAVGATVSPSAAFEVELKAPPLVISSTDLSRGYVEITVRSRLGITTTRGAIPHSPQYLVEFVPRSDIFTSVTVRAPSGSDLERASRAFVSGAVHEADTTEFIYRFDLAQGLQPGNYSWPMSVRAEL